MKLVPKTAFRRQHTGSRVGDEMQRLPQEIQQQLQRCPFLIGRAISVKLAAATAFTVNHGIGRPAACLILRQNYDGTGNTAKLTESSTATQASLDLNNQLSIVADVACWLDLWFYPRATSFVQNNPGQSA
jgi:hypothetical protein